MSLSRLLELDDLIGSLYTERSDLLSRELDDKSRRRLVKVEKEIIKLELEEVDLLWNRAESAKRRKRIEALIQGDKELAKYVQEYLENIRKN